MRKQAIEIVAMAHIPAPLSRFIRSPALPPRRFIRHPSPSPVYLPSPTSLLTIQLSISLAAEIHLLKITSMKPRHLYFSLFSYYALSGGRFTAPFLEHQLKLDENWMIGLALALQILVGSICSPFFGILADKWYAESNGCHGRLAIMLGGMVVSLVATLLHSIPLMIAQRHEYEDTSITTAVLMYHLILRCIIAMALSATSPVLNGLTLARLQKDGRDSNEYGQERLCKCRC